MKLVQYFKEDEICLGVKTDKGIVDVRAAVTKFAETVPVHLQDFLCHSEEIARLSTLVNRVVEEDVAELFLTEEEVTYAPAVTNPEKILCIGLNYIDHAKETNMAIPTSPILFSKFNNALAAHRDEVVIPQGTEQMDYEAELVIVMGKKAKNVSEEEALSYVFGYSAGNDISARDLQMKTHQWLLGKTPDGFAPVGPCIVTSDEINPHELKVECRINGEIRQQGTTNNMIFNCAALISYISKYMTLKPGDIIFTGTPAGVILGYPKEKQVWLKSGDEMIVSIESIGELKTILK